ncbi:hypothetical protein C8P68_101140 [Mucilaginibacter yixingensis]|uniref:Quercetin 2,3-dioxygenase C-terminal cupin domain-containing protein n=1 Tax=Mucilaginibacter yixingensis TaxID=1295612 RepID=A0A2T5JEP6_9SPHI|nr:hypothetical protein [Mucilaginibacter yixingensis]PTR00911.1 hypothetical protein C8P68_101140 [Mucilaginibacter yixingensis]
MELPGQIFVADKRVLEENNTYRRYSVFNQGNQPFGSLTIANDEMIAAGGAVQIAVTHNAYFVLLPITGEVILNHEETITHADAGQAYVYFAKAGSTVELSNPYADHWINFLYLQIQTHDTSVYKCLANFDFGQTRNQLTDIFKDDDLPFALHIGLFAGRGETLYQTYSRESRLFAFVVTGAFELQGRLLHERDSLALWNLEEADMEALSNDAVMVVLEMY